MTTWILILTLFSDHPYGGQTMTSIPSFQSREACVAAGDQWIKQARVEYNVNRAKALCVPSAIKR